VTTVDELQAVIEKSTTAAQLLPVTQQIIASLGITTFDEWMGLSSESSRIVQPCGPTPRSLLLRNSRLADACRNRMYISAAIAAPREGGRFQ